MRRRPQVGTKGVELGDLVQVIEGLNGLSGPPYAYYGGSAFDPQELPARGAMWLPGHRLATKVPGDRGTVFHANPPFRWSEQAGRMREYPAFDDPGYPDWIDPVRGPGPEGLYDTDLTARVYAQPIQAKIPTGVVPRMEAAGMHYAIRGKYFPGDDGPSVSGLGALGQPVTLSDAEYDRLLRACTPSENQLQLLACMVQKIKTDHGISTEAAYASINDAIRRRQGEGKSVTEPVTSAAASWLPWAAAGAAAVGVIAWALSRRR